MATDDVHTPPIKTTQTVFGIIECLQRNDGATLTEVTNETERAKSTIHSHLQTLKDMEYVVEEDGEYDLGLKFLDHGHHAKKQLPITEAIGSTLEQLAEETGEVAWVMVEEHGKAVCLEVASGDRAVRTLDRTGLRTPLNFHAAGKAILANLPSERLEAILDQHGLPASTPNTITDREELYEELEATKERGYALNDGEAVEGIRSVAAPVMHEDEVVAAVNVQGPTKRLTGSQFRETLPQAVLGAANAIELSYTYT
jgi:DNA-binding IclR family transcriptional regulator